jgi:hypothetical protein
VSIQDCARLNSACYLTHLEDRLDVIIHHLNIRLKHTEATPHLTTGLQGIMGKGS